ncbi:hypothetical protein P9112_000460 [Eukaryota sp. TZLM1-RC]
MNPSTPHEALSNICSSWAQKSDLFFDIESHTNNDDSTQFSVSFFSRSAAHPVPSFRVYVNFTIYVDRLSGFDILYKIEDESHLRDTNNGFNPEWLTSVLRRKELMFQ